MYAKAFIRASYKLYIYDYANIRTGICLLFAVCHFVIFPHHSNSQSLLFNQMPYLFVYTMLMVKIYMMRFSILSLMLFVVMGSTMAQQDREYLRESLPTQWNDSEYFNQTLPPDDKWWRNFNDPVLDSLIAVAGNSNYSVLAAIENIRKARAAWRTAQGKMLPAFDFSAGWQRTKTSGNIAQTMYTPIYITIQCPKK